MIPRIVFAAAACLSAFAQPTVTLVTNAAGYMRPGLPSAGLAQGSYIAIFGTNLAPEGLEQREYPLSPSLFNGVLVTVVQGSTGYNLPVTYTTPTQVGAIVRSTIPAGPATLRVTYNEKFAEIPVNIVARSFGMFTLNQAGSGPVVAYKYSDSGAASVVSLFDSLQPGKVGTIFGTGLGGVTTDDALPVDAAATLTNDVELWIGTKKAQIGYAGRIPGISAVDQINFTVPADAPTGCYVGILVKTNGVISNGGTLPVTAAGKTCSDAHGYSAEVLEAAQARGDLRWGRISLLRTDFAGFTSSGGPENSVSESIFATFNRSTLAQLTNSQSFTSAGSCVVASAAGQFVLSGSGSWSRLNAGPALTVLNASGTRTVNRSASVGNYSANYTVSMSPLGSTTLSPEFVVAGDHAVSLPGGPDVGAFLATLRRPAPFAWTSAGASTAIQRSADLEVVWTGGDAEGIVSIFGASVGRAGSSFVTGSFTCVAAASAGRFTIPAAVLQAMPVSAAGTGGVPMGQIQVSYENPRLVTAPAMDSLRGSVVLGSGKTIGFQ